MHSWHTEIRSLCQVGVGVGVGVMFRSHLEMASVALMEVISALKDLPRSTPSTWMSAAAEDVVRNKASSRTVAGQHARLNSTAPSMPIVKRSFRRITRNSMSRTLCNQGVELWMYAESLP